MWSDFGARRMPHFPPLSWVCALQRDSPRPLLLHGDNVEVAARAFFEGAWAGPFPELGYVDCVSVFGSGGRLIDGDLAFVTPSHTLEALYLSEGEVILVSNSLALLLAFGKDELRSGEWRYGEVFSSIVMGLPEEPLRIPTRKGSVRVVHHRNVLVSRHGSVQIADKPPPPPFQQFESYAQYLRQTINETVRNAADPGRRATYTPLTTVSAGYDSAACAVLAQSVGCRDAVTIRLARGGLEDSGRAVAAALGLKLHEVDPVEHADATGESVAEFLATGMQGEDLAFKVFEDWLPKRVLLTGFHGDKVWDRYVTPNSVMKRGDISGSSLGEFRLRIGFVHLPVPFVGCQRHADIQRISNSEEMFPYQVGGDYDRPVPRRIVETAGVERGAFGQRKRAVTQLLFWEDSPAARSVQRAVREFEAAKADIAWRARLSYGWRSLRWESLRFLVRVAERIRARGDRTGVSSGSGGKGLFARLAGQEFAVFEHAHPRNTAWTRWAIWVIQRRYRNAAAAPEIADLSV